MFSQFISILAPTIQQQLRCIQLNNSVAGILKKSLPYASPGLLLLDEMLEGYSTHCMAQTTSCLYKCTHSGMITMC